MDQTGEGHFCPIGGFNSNASKALMLDTARFKYPPHWVDLQQIFEAIKTFDKDTGKSRGFIMLARKVTKSKKLPPLIARQPRLEKLDLFNLYLHASIGSSLTSVIEFLSQKKLKTVLFCYLF